MKSVSSQTEGAVTVITVGNPPNSANPNGVIVRHMNIPPSHMSSEQSLGKSSRYWDSVTNIALRSLQQKILYPLYKGVYRRRGRQQFLVLNYDAVPCFILTSSLYLYDVTLTYLLFVIELNIVFDRTSVSTGRYDRPVSPASNYTDRMSMMSSGTVSSQHGPSVSRRKPRLNQHSLR